MFSIVFLDILNDGATFADGGVAGIGEEVAAFGFRNEPPGEQALDHFGAGATAQVGWQGFDVAIGAAGGGLDWLRCG